MIRSIAVTLAAATLIACNNESESGKTNDADSASAKTDSAMHNTLTDAQKTEGWQLLFDGQSTSGWHKYGGEPVGSAWKVIDGAMYLDSATKKDGKIEGGGDIVTNDEFENFHLKLEWNIAKNGNSGIMFYVHEDTMKFKRPYDTGPEMQVLDNNGHADGQYPKHRAGDLYDLIACSRETVKPAGEWNLAEIKCVNGKLDLFLNGENVVSTTMWDDNWKKLVNSSKFKGWPGFATYKKGRICLQDHDNTVSYRNIMIRKL
jgi:hypothetical protein